MSGEITMDASAASNEDVAMHDEDQADAGNNRDCPLEAIYRNQPPFELLHFSPIKRTAHHTVLYELPFQPESNVPPSPYSGGDQDINSTSSTVRFPFSVRCLIRSLDGTTSVGNRWTLVCQALAKPITSTQQLEAVIQQYNPEYKARVRFSALHRLFKECEDVESAAFFGETLPRIVALALRLRDLFPKAVPLMSRYAMHTVSMSQEQAACLLANAFLCTFPAPTHASTYTNFNFAPLFAGRSQAVVEKIKCLCHYFRRVCTTMPTGVVTYMRRFIFRTHLPEWESCSWAVFSRDTVPFHVTSEGTIEDGSDGLLQMVFANRSVGGGVIGNGCVQEEIRFVINPELLVGRLLFEKLRETEAYIVIGAERFCTYANYAATFTFENDFRDGTPRDASGRRRSYILGLDAVRVQPGVNQYEEELVRRELNKAYVGFWFSLPDSSPPGIATGNWGCGAFGGNAHLKALLQLMVACVTERPLLYFTCNDASLQRDLVRMYSFLVEREVDAAKLYNAILRYPTEADPAGLYAFLYKEL